MAAVSQGAIFDRESKGIDMADVELNPQPLPPGRAIRVHVPASVMFDLEAFQRAQASVLKQVGHPGCTSGVNLFWQTYSEYAVDPSGEARPVSGGLAE
jgi:hypothetical protein